MNTTTWQWTRRALLTRLGRIVGLALLMALSLTLLDLVVGRLYTRITSEAGRLGVSQLMGGGPKEASSGFFLQHPYMFFTYLPHYKAFGIEQFDAYGHRGREIPPERTPGVYRILALGESTTISFPYIRNPTNTWCAKLGEILTQESGRKVEVINAGLRGGNSADLLLHYMFRERDFKPDLVILHVGGNDGQALLFPNYTPEYTHYIYGWRSSMLAPRPYEKTWLRSNIVKTLYAHWLKNVSLDSALGRDMIQTLTPEESLRNVEKNEPAGFERNMHVLIQDILEDKATPVLFPFVCAPKDRFLRDRLQAPYYDALVLSYAKNRSVLDRLAMKYGLPTITIPEGAIDAKCFFDYCHVNEEGDLIKARYAAAVLLPIIEKNTVAPAEHRE